jgi:6-phosphofructokinase 2
MSKIITITFSPSIDKSASVPAMQSNIKMRCSAANTEPGGGGINVARVIKRLGGDVKAIFPSGGYTGMFFNHLLENEEVPFVSIQTKNETKENFVILDESTKKEYRFGMPSNELFEEEWKACLKSIENHKNVDFIIASGSLPSGIPVDIYAQLSKIAKTSNAKFIVDTSGEALKNAVDDGVYLLKPNIEELGILLDIKDLKIQNIEVAARDLIHKNNIEIVVVSLGANGAMLVTKDEAFTIKPPKVKVKSTIGAGDSMVAGIVFGLSNNLSLLECLQYGIACGTATTMNLGSELCDKKEVDKLLKIIKTQAL